MDGGILKQWNGFIKEIEALSEVRIPRCYFLNEAKPVQHQLHGFSHASEKAFAAVVYLRTLYTSGEVNLRLIASKTRVAPLKKQSIPRLELLGAYILSKLVASVREAQVVSTDTEEFYWTDSYTTLCWIRNNKPWKQYVQHRVEEIRKGTNTNNWRFCPGQENPADLPSRCCSGRELIESNSWWNEPEFLQKTKEEWPNMPTSFQNDKSYEDELVKHPVNVTHSLTNTVGSQNGEVNLNKVIDIKRYSSRVKLLRITALIMKFIRLLKRDKDARTNKDLNVKDLEEAERMWIRNVQVSQFKIPEQSIASVTSGSMISKYKELDIYTDKEGIMMYDAVID